MRIPRNEPDYPAITKKVDADFTCGHEQTIKRKKLAVDGAISVWQQCQKCGSKVGPAIRKATLTPAELDDLPVWDGQVETHFFAQKQKHYYKTLEQEKERLHAEWEQTYQEYLKTPEWQKKRQLVLLRAQGICEGCRSAPATDVHHLTYADVGEEFLFQLVAMCRRCHERWHAHPQSDGDVQPKLNNLRE